MAASFHYVNGYNLTQLADFLVSHFGEENITIHESSSSNLIFTAPAISDKVIRFNVSSSIMRTYYGSAYNDVDGTLVDQVPISGSSTLGTAEYHVMCATENVLLVNQFLSSQNARLFIIGKLTTGDFAVLGCVGSNSSNHYPAFYGYNTTTGSLGWVYGPAGTVRMVDNKLLKHPVIFYDLMDGASYDNDGKPAAFLDISFSSIALGNTVFHKGDNYFLSSSGLYGDNGRRVYNSILVEGIEES